MKGTRFIISGLAILAWTGRMTAQDYFPDPIPLSGIEVSLETVAVLPDSATNDPPRVNLVTLDPAGRLFANDQDGPLYLIDDNGGVTEYLDLRDYPELAVLSTGEPGFQSFAFHPDFHQAGAPGNGKFYTIHSCTNTSGTPDFDPGGGTSFHTLLLEWHAADPQATTFAPADPGNPYRELMRLKQPYSNHNAGLLTFNPMAAPGDPDYGNLYIAIGDGGSGDDPLDNGQDPSNPFAAILRIDPLGSNSANGQYGLVAANALAGDGNPATLAEIWCYGLRNPQRYGWDIRTGNCFIADIGQNAVEEINLAANGANFGWPVREGSFDYLSTGTAGMTDPVAEYDHTNTVASPPATTRSNRAVTVGEVARGTGIPGLEGKLMLADFPMGTIFTLDVGSDPLDGGQDGLFLLTLLDDQGQPTTFLEMINAVRAGRGLGAVRRTDLRFSVNTPGLIYVSNKHDGHLRRIRPSEPAALEMNRDPSGQPQLEFQGLLQSSTDLESWRTVIPQPESPWIPPVPEDASFWRSTIP